MPHFAHSGFVGISSGAQKEKALKWKIFFQKREKDFTPTLVIPPHFVIAGRGRGL